MFKSLQDFFSNSNSSQDAENASDDADLKLAAATLMLEVVRADGQVQDTEIATMRDLLHQQFQLDEADIENMLELAHTSSEDAICLQGFTREICNNWGNAKRLKLLEHLWQIALADETIDAHERHLIRKLAGLLYLNDSEVARAKATARINLAQNNG